MAPSSQPASPTTAEASRVTQAGCESIRGESIRGESIRGESIRGESIRGESIRGESIRGESIRGESIRGRKLLIAYRFPLEARGRILVSVSIDTRCWLKSTLHIVQYEKSSRIGFQPLIENDLQHKGG
jgi:hypothetical protein